MRVQASRAVALEAERIGGRIVDTYLALDRSFVELRQMLADGSLDILGPFGDACRAEFASLRAEQF